MCGISGIFGRDPSPLQAMVACQHHRGPDAQGLYLDPAGAAALGHNRLSIIDLSDAGRQPMSSADGRYWIAFNGEIYNYLELRRELQEYPFQSRTDTEVILAAYRRWGCDCLHHLIGMFAFLLWDEQEQQLFAARDRFGVKPLHYHRDPAGGLVVASEIKALFAAGVAAEPDPVTWAAYFDQGLNSHSERTFYRSVRTLPPGHCLTWSKRNFHIDRWYDLAEAAGAELDSRPLQEVMDEYLVLLAESVRLRFRSDVPVGVNLSGGLDSSVLLGVMQQLQGSESQVRIFTFATGDPEYDELPWVERMLAGTRHPWSVSYLTAEDVPAWAEAITHSQDEPFGGLPTLAYAKLFAQARAEGVIVLLDGQGMDEAWAGYDYYAAALADGAGPVSTVQGTNGQITRRECLVPEFRQLAAELGVPEEPVFPDKLRCIQYRDARFTKLPRALRFNDRVSMAAATELREPFLDHRLFEYALRQPPDRKRRGLVGKWFLRELAQHWLPQSLRQTAKRPMQTPQREWLRGPLREWAGDCIEKALEHFGGSWLETSAVRSSWSDFLRGQGDNSYFAWQWISLGLRCQQPTAAPFPLAELTARPWTAGNGFEVARPADAGN